MISQIAAVFVIDYLPIHKNVLQFEHFLVSFIFLLVCVCLCVGAIFTRVLICSIWKFWQSNVTLAPTSSFFCPHHIYLHVWGTKGSGSHQVFVLLNFYENIPLKVLLLLRLGFPCIPSTLRETTHFIPFEIGRHQKCSICEFASSTA